MLVHREVRPGTPRDAAPVVCLHGWPESGRMWDPVLEALGAAGYLALAPDLPGYGDSPRVRPATWELHRTAFEDWRQEQELDRVSLVVHDWGGLIGLRWACDHPEAVRALVISDTGFFSDGKWHGLAETLRTQGEGEALLESFDRAAFGATLGAVSSGVDERTLDHYFQAFADEPRRRGNLELYRSGDMEKLAPYEGCLAKLAVPTLVLWGADDTFAPVAGAERLHSEIAGSELVVVEGAGHFVWEDAPERCATELVRFLNALPDA